jgi:hypothetical protein
MLQGSQVKNVRDTTGRPALLDGPSCVRRRLVVYVA